MALAGWMNRHQQDVNAYIQEEDRILKNKLKRKRIRFTDDERRRLVVKGKALVRLPQSDYKRLTMRLCADRNRHRRHLPLRFRHVHGMGPVPAMVFAIALGGGILRWLQATPVGRRSACGG